jgi:hypothetical protein
MGGRSAVQLLRDRRHWGRQGDLVIIATATQVDDVGVMRIAQDSIEESRAEAFAIAREDLEGLTAKCRRRNCRVTLDQRLGRTLHEIECLISRQALAALADIVLRGLRLGARGMRLGARGLGPGTWGLRCGGRDVGCLTVTRRCGDLHLTLAAIVSFPRLPVTIAAAATSAATPATPALLPALATICIAVTVA